MTDENGAELCSPGEVEFVALALDAKLRGKIKQMARRAKLEDQTALLNAVVKV